jgi:hypothetical protein
VSAGTPHCSCKQLLTRPPLHVPPMPCMPLTIVTHAYVQT